MATVINYRFGGELGYNRDAGNRLYVRARHLDTGKGCWDSKDPIGLSGRDANFYRYVRNNPVTLLDPSGLTYCGACSTLYTNLGALVDIPYFQSIETLQSNQRSDLAGCRVLLNPFAIDSGIQRFLGCVGIAMTRYAYEAYKLNGDYQDAKRAVAQLTLDCLNTCTSAHSSDYCVNSGVISGGAYYGYHLCKYSRGSQQCGGLWLSASAGGCPLMMLQDSLDV